MPAATSRPRAAGRVGDTVARRGTCTALSARTGEVAHCRPFSRIRGAPPAPCRLARFCPVRSGANRRHGWVGTRVLLFVFGPNPAIRRKRNFGRNFANSERKAILNSKTEISFNSDRNFGHIDRNFGDFDRNFVFVDRKMMLINRK